MTNNDKNKKNLDDLKNLLLDIDDLNKLESRPFNVFDVLKITRTEIRHSNVLAWVLDPHENHGLGTAILSMLNAYLSENKFISTKDAIEILTMDYSDITVYREWMNIDILIESNETKYIICIENKIDTQDHNKQLDKYFKIIQEKYPDYKKTFLYLTPEGLEPKEDNYGVWKCLDYATIVSILEKALKTHSIDQETEKFILSYCEILRREIMKDNEIVALCQKIYKKHKSALDLIYENRPDRLQNVSEYFKVWCDKQASKGEIIWDKGKSIKSCLRFKTISLNNLSIPENNDSNNTWKTTNNYFYEISADDRNGDIYYYIKLVFNIITLSQEDISKIEKINEKARKLANNKSKSPKKSKEFKTVYKSDTKNFDSSADLPDDLENNEFFDNLNEMWESIKNSGIEQLIENYFPKKS